MRGMEMIQWVSGWLKEIIFVILFATFIDLILPNSTMQRYVKVVISLFILLTILSPIIHLLTSDFDADQVSMSIEELSAKEASHSQIKPLENIMKDSNRMKADYEKQAITIAEDRLAAMVKEQIEKEGTNAVKSVKAKLADNVQGQPSVDSIQIVLSAEGKSELTDKFKPVEPIMIHIDVDDSKSRSTQRKTENNEITEKMGHLRDQVIRQVSKDWGISPDKISVEYDIED